MVVRRGVGLIRSTTTTTHGSTGRATWMQASSGGSGCGLDLVAAAVTKVLVVAQVEGQEQDPVLPCVPATRLGQVLCRPPRLSLRPLQQLRLCHSNSRVLPLLPLLLHACRSWWPMAVVVPIRQQKQATLTK